MERQRKLRISPHTHPTPNASFSPISVINLSKILTKEEKMLTERYE